MEVTHRENETGLLWLRLSNHQAAVDGGNIGD